MNDLRVILGFPFGLLAETFARITIFISGDQLNVDFSYLREQKINNTVRKFMNDQILGFRTFNTEADFIDWQKEAPRKLYQVTPLVFSMGAEVFNETGKVEAVVNAGCFVLYFVANR